MNIERAYTYVDAGTARLGNRWFERSWSAFLGQSVELQFPRGQQEWSGASSPEFALELDGVTHGFMELGTVEWSEECDSLGATLVSTYVGDRVELISRATAFHSFPGMLRRWLLINRGEAPVQLGRVVLDLIHIRSDNVVLEPHQQVAFMRTFGKLGIYAASGTDTYLPDADNPQLLGMVKDFSAPLAPATWTSLAESYLLWVHGQSRQALQREWPQFLEHVNQYKQAEEEALRLRLREDESPD